MSHAAVVPVLDAVPSDLQADEHALLEGLLADDVAAWRQFNLQYTGLVRSCISRVTERFRGLVTREDVREIHAQFFVNLLSSDKRRLRSFDPQRGVRLSSWLGMLAVHAAYDYLRVLRRQPSGPNIDDLPDLSADLPDPDDHCNRREQAHWVAQVLDELSAKDREFMTLYFGRGLPPHVVAETMGISIKTVYTKKHKIRSRLEAMMQAERAAA